MAMLWAIAIASLFAMFLSFIVMLFFPRDWIAADVTAAKSLKQMGIPPWGYLNRLGKAAHVLLYVAGSVLLVSLSLGAWFENVK